MLKKEKKCVYILSISLLGIILFTAGNINNLFYYYLMTIPLYIIVVITMVRKSESRAKIELAVNNCLDESEFNVIDEIEKLRIFFNDTTDVIKYLTVVESRVLTYVFNDENLKLNYNEYVCGAIKCLTIFKKYSGSYYFDIDIITISNDEKISTLLSTLYMVSKLINQGSNTLYISSRQKNVGISIEVTDENRLNSHQDVFCLKLLNIFSSNQFELTTRII